MLGTPRRRWLAVVLTAAIVSVAGALLLLRSDPPVPFDQAAPSAEPSLTASPLVRSPSASPAATPSVAQPSEPQECEVSPILVNSCRAWLGARAFGYTSREESFLSQTEYHEERIGRQIDIAHTYTAVGGVPLTNAHDVALAKRPDTYLFANWKPAAQWAAVTGDQQQVEARIDKAIGNVKALGSKKIFMTLHHEPENDVTVADGCQTKAGASAGTPAQYRQMWRHVRERFDAAGVRNVVWVMDYMNYPPWDCLVPLLYPGDSYVDWIMFNAYGSSWRPDFAANVDRFYQLLTSLSRPGRDLLGKPWGIAEWGVHDASAAQARDYYAQAARALVQNKFPKLKAYLVFDSPGTHNQGGLRIGYDDAGRADPEEEVAYRRFTDVLAASGRLG